MSYRLIVIMLNRCRLGAFVCVSCVIVVYRFDIVFIESFDLRLKSL